MKAHVSSDDCLFVCPVSRREAVRISPENWGKLVKAMNARRFNADTCEDFNAEKYLLLPQTSFASIGTEADATSPHWVKSGGMSVYVPDTEWESNQYRVVNATVPHKGWYHSAGETKLLWIVMTDGWVRLSGIMSARLAEQCDLPEKARHKLVRSN